MAYDVGDVVRCTAAFADSAGTAINPTAVIFEFRTPAGTLTSYTYGTDAQVIRPSTGNYYVDVEATRSGTWHYRFYSTGTGQTAGEGSFEVNVSRFV